ncbi:CBS domain-containing protein [Ketogulonicigenium vulgare]|uniref:CBS domain-containing protein n=1 Tax=Ketogulonicigenium vulgare TaxID=92945 RepID=UPI0023581EAB|nr:CBS domain-containing protein [Ketogulonicigenium vulgare]
MSDASNQPPSTQNGLHEEQGEAASNEGQSRGGFLSRIFDALNPQDSAKTAEAIGPVLGIGNLRRLEVEDVATPKAEIVALPVDSSFDFLVETFRETGMSRIPVYEGTLDTPLGMVNLKDLALKFGFGADVTGFDLRGILRPVLYVPPSMPLGALLAKMQAERIHMALVIDEYGGTDGLLTIEDLIETVVGEIEDEHDIEELDDLTQESPLVWEADATVSLQNFAAQSGFDLTADDGIDEEEVETLGGLAFMLSGDVPETGEIIAHPAGASFEVLDADNRRIKRLRINLPEAVPE